MGGVSHPLLTQKLDTFGVPSNIDLRQQPHPIVPNKTQSAQIFFCSDL